MRENNEKKSGWRGGREAEKNEIITMNAAQLYTHWVSQYQQMQRRKWNETK